LIAKDRYIDAVDVFNYMAAINRANYRFPKNSMIYEKEIPKAPTISDVHYKILKKQDAGFLDIIMSKTGLF